MPVLERDPEQCSRETEHRIRTHANTRQALAVRVTPRCTIAVRLSHEGLPPFPQKERTEVVTYPKRADNTQQGMDLLALGNQLCFALYSASLEMTKLYRPLLEPLNLTYPQYLVMLVLWEQSGILVKELGARLHLDSGTLTPLLKRLEKAGFVRRQRDPRDERGVLVSLTKQGEHLKVKALEVPQVIGCAMGMSAKNIVALHKSILEAREHVQAYREAMTSGENK
jgi:DNA-binding MarR family transcriptional regulator